MITTDGQSVVIELVSIAGFRGSLNFGGFKQLNLTLKNKNKIFKHEFYTSDEETMSLCLLYPKLGINSSEPIAWYSHTM